MLKRTRLRIIDAVERAANWLEANREHHIVGVEAVNSDGSRVDNNSKTAECFCAIGRICNELNQKTVWSDDLRQAIGLSTTAIVGSNDRDMLESFAACKSTPRRKRQRSGKSVIRLLRKHVAQARAELETN